MIMTCPAGVSFLVCTYNSALRISETLRCLAQQIVIASVPWEVILVDNACTDDTTTVAETYWQQLGTPAPLYIFKQPKPGKNFAVELAFQKAQYRYCCIVDDDNRLDPDYLQTGYNLLETHPQVGILGGPNTGVFETTPPAWFLAFQQCYAVGEQPNYVEGKMQPLADGNIGQNVLWGAGMFVRTDLWYQLRQLEFKSLFVGRQGTKNLTAGEDDELCYAAQIIGYEIWYSSKLHLCHYMTSNRLTEDYRNKLFYSSVWGLLRMQAYRNTLWGQPGKDYSKSINLMKDFAYMTRTMARRILSTSYARALVKKDIQFLMHTKHSFLFLYDFIVNFNNIKLYYQRVAAFKNKAEVHRAKKLVS